MITQSTNLSYPPSSSRISLLGCAGNSLLDKNVRSDNTAHTTSVILFAGSAPREVYQLRSSPASYAPKRCTKYFWHTYTMKTYPRQTKTNRNSRDSYFGNYGEIPIGLSSATMSTVSKSDDTLHFHKKSIEFYLALEGSGTIEIEGRDYALEPDSLVMVEPGEKHRVKSSTKAPFSYIVFATVKDKDDKVKVD